MRRLPLTARESWQHTKETNRFARVIAAARLMRKSFTIGNAWLPDIKGK